ncbi:amino acid ABC transporter substrate-binding protein [Ferrovibrio sp.]|uniref:amino acid ABC transporter substrate-binding protein n=1 Tax=Ferrovibrio sp. TaxID=1917215 RepID=UPI001B52D969|nr:amino acid ABC transporter substrate-binding protein [Ferrovibrio sp.]MBP7065968.1 amino acid ABC transporter substrate-binding protein [Ferrovibrio sp.]
MQFLKSAAAAAVLVLAAQGAQAGATLDAVKARGKVMCGVSTGVSGFSAPDSQGKWSGIDVDVCRSIAAALFGDASKHEVVALTPVQRFTALQSGEIDVLTRNTTLTLQRDTALGLNAVAVNFYDGQGFMVPVKLGVKSAKELNGATVCVQPGTTTELNLADYFRANKLSFKPVVIEKQDEVVGAYVSGRCDVFTTDRSQLASVRATQTPKPEEHILLPEVISKEPLGPMVRHGDDQWMDLVRWSLFAMVEGEEYGITSANVDQMMASSTDPNVKRILGATPGMGKALGVDEKWAYNIIKQVGNYGESFERNVGKGSALKLDRGPNELWTKGGLMYAWPIR